MTNYKTVLKKKNIVESVNLLEVFHLPDKNGIIIFLSLL